MLTAGCKAFSLANGGTSNNILFPLLPVGIFCAQQVRIQTRCFSLLSDVQVKCRKIWSTSQCQKPFQLPSHPLKQILLTESLRQAMNSTTNSWLVLSLNQTPTSHHQIQREKWTKLSRTLENNNKMTTLSISTLYHCQHCKKRNQLQTLWSRKITSLLLCQNWGLPQPLLELTKSS